jgi:nitrogen fixation/metabolism regulation signal transduction histidine kinase
MFSTVRVGLHLAKGSAISIEQLAEDIRRVAHGNLDFTLHVTSHDELGLLAAFFNQMTCDLRRSKMAIEQTSEELRAMEHRARSGAFTWKPYSRILLPGL